MMYGMLLPGNRTDFAVVTGKEFEVENVDVAVAVEVGGGGCRRVVAHANGHGIELVNDTIVVNITRRQTDLRHGGRRSSGQRGRTLGAEETLCAGGDGVSSSGSGQAEITARIG